MDVIVKVRDPEENLEEKIKAYKVKKRIKTAVTILAFVFALISSYLLVKLQTYTSLRTLQSYKNKETESSDLKYLQYADGMLKYGRDGIAYINKKGVEQWNQSYQIKDPVINVSGKAMAVAERGGNDIYVMDEKGAKGEIHTNYPIEKIAVAENGIVSTILNNENSPMVVCYDARKCTGRAQSFTYRNRIPDWNRTFAERNETSDFIFVCSGWCRGNKSRIPEF